jgi:hypothetical protein
MKRRRIIQKITYFMFLNLKGEGIRLDFYVVPSSKVADYIKKEHAEWRETPGKHGRQHNETPMRMFRDYSDEFLENWQLLGLV